MVGAVFLSEGRQRFLFAAEVGVGRFAKIGLPSAAAIPPDRANASAALSD
jgi:hypothetical protein